MEIEHKRDFTSYTLQELKSWIVDQEQLPEMAQRLRKEIAMRESELSTPKVTPQAKW